MKILMVCLGNICRSPMAEAIMRDIAEKRNLPIEVDSAGFEAYHLGDAPDPRAQQCMLSHGIDISQQRQRLVEPKDFDIFDKIFIMDDNNLRLIKRVARNAQDMQKVDYIMNAVHPFEDENVPDPYMGGQQGFEHVFQMLTSACNKIADSIE